MQAVERVYLEDTSEVCSGLGSCSLPGWLLPGACYQN
jgi:hypothetical protein